MTALVLAMLRWLVVCALAALAAAAEPARAEVRRR
jgi:hypothetical protein